MSDPFASVDEWRAETPQLQSTLQKESIPPYATQPRSTTRVDYEALFKAATETWSRLAVSEPKQQEKSDIEPKLISNNEMLPAGNDKSYAFSHGNTNAGPRASPFAATPLRQQIRAGAWKGLSNDPNETDALTPQKKEDDFGENIKKKQSRKKEVVQETPVKKPDERQEKASNPEPLPSFQSQEQASVSSTPVYLQNSQLSTQPKNSLRDEQPQMKQEPIMQQQQQNSFPTLPPVAAPRLSAQQSHFPQPSSIIATQNPAILGSSQRLASIDQGNNPAPLSSNLSLLSLDPDVAMWQQHVMEWMSQMKQTATHDFLAVKSELLARQQSALQQTREQYEKQLQDHFEQLEQIKEAYAKSQQTIQRLESCHEKHLNFEIQARKWTEKKRAFQWWRQRLESRRRENLLIHVAACWAMRQEAKRVLNAWYQVTGQTRRLTLERQLKADWDKQWQDRESIHAKEIQDRDQSNAELKQRLRQLLITQARQRHLMKQAFMRGVCALNMEAMEFFPNDAEQAILDEETSKLSDASQIEIAPKSIEIEERKTDKQEKFVEEHVIELLPNTAEPRPTSPIAPIARLERKIPPPQPAPVTRRSLVQGNERSVQPSQESNASSNSAPRTFTTVTGRNVVTVKRHSLRRGM